MCTFSILPLPVAMSVHLRVCVCVWDAQNVSAWLFFFHSPRYLFMSRPFSSISLVLRSPVSLFDCSSDPENFVKKSDGSVQIWPSTRLPSLSVLYHVCFSLSFSLLIINSYLHRLVSKLDISFKAEVSLTHLLLALHNRINHLSLIPLCI